MRKFKSNIDPYLMLPPLVFFFPRLPPEKMSSEHGLQLIVLRKVQSKPVQGGAHDALGVAALLLGGEVGGVQVDLLLLELVQLVNNLQVLAAPHPLLLLPHSLVTVVLVRADQAGANLQKAKYQDSRLREHKGKSRGKEKVVTQTENSEKVKEKQKSKKL